MRVSMRALVVHGPDGAGATASLLDAVEMPVPALLPRSLLVRVSVCGVCRTDLDVAEGRLVASRHPIIPGHQIVGRVAAVGDGAEEYREGDRVAVAWIHSTCGECAWCREGRENLCPRFRGTGCDAHGGYAEYVSVPADYAHPIPSEAGDAEVAPLLCAGAVGWRALRLAHLRDGRPLGLAGFGASNHLVLQFALASAPHSPVFVFARNAEEQAFARQLGAHWAGSFDDTPPEKLAAIIDTTPAWRPVIASLEHLAPGGRLVVNAIRKTAGDISELLRLDYARHLWMEREIRSVANVTRADVREALAVAARIGLRPSVTELPLERATDALRAMQRGDAVRGATVLRVAEASSLPQP
jgi:propanol-preferring alcohol dehydrogenase